MIFDKNFLLDLGSDRILMYACGIFTGFFGSYCVLQDHFEKKFAEEHRRAEEIIRIYNEQMNEQEQNLIEEYVKTSEESITGREEGILEPEKRSEIKKIWRTEGKGDNTKVNYSGYYKPKNVSEADLDVIDTRETTGEATEEIDKFREPKKPTPPGPDDVSLPRIASKKEVDLLPDFFETVKMSYYVYDDKLVIHEDGRERPVKPEDYVGDCLIKRGFDHDSSTFLYVLNYKLSTVYKIEKEWALYEH